MLLKPLFTISFVLFFAAQMLANNSLKRTMIVVESDTIVLDSNSIEATSIQLHYIDGKPVRNNLFAIEGWSARLIVDSVLIGRTLTAQFRAFPFNFSRSVYRFKRPEQDIIPTPNQPNTIVKLDPVNSSADLLDLGGLDYDGNLTRGIIIGSNRDLSVNSNLNLQLSGFLTDDIELTAAISDNNIPIQPEGNTQQLQEFDQIYIKLRKDQNELIAGDYSLKSGESQILQFNKQLQGLSFAGVNKVKKINLHTDASFAVSRGQFVVQQIQPQEGNQGPYKLTGENGELFIIVLSGSEKVFVNGVLLKRGLDHDYTIDYNLGEITFTSNFLVTQDVRIRIEFEYAEQSYFRSLLHSSVGVSGKRGRFFVHGYSEQDNKNQPVVLSLTAEQRSFLQQLGDDNATELFPGFQTAELDANRIQYRFIDTLVEGVLYDSVLVLAGPNTDAQVYQVAFSLVGAGQGNYVRGNSGVNGITYNWIAPQDGIPQGDYAPLIQLTAPQRNQMLELNGELQINRKLKLETSLAISRQDLNTFSDQDDADNNGLATINQLQYQTQIRADSNKLYQAKINHNLQSSNFQVVERYRPVEYFRNWNINQNETQVTDQVFGFEQQLSLNQKVRFGQQLGYLHRSNNHQAAQGALNFNLTHKKWLIDASVNAVLTEKEQGNGRFFTPRLDASYQFKPGKLVGVNLLNEYNLLKIDSAERSIEQGFINEDVELYVQVADSMKLPMRFALGYEYHALPDSNQLATQTRALKASWRGDLTFRKRQKLIWQLNYRRLIEAQDSILAPQGANFYLGKLIQRWSAVKGLFKGQGQYEIGSERERRIQVSYQLVGPGLGNFAWIDDGDSIKEVNEFVVSPFANANDHVRVITNTVEFLSVNRVQLNYVLNINLAAKLKKGGASGFFRRIATRTFYETEQKVLTQMALERTGAFFSPFAQEDLPDSAKVNQNERFKQSVFFNRTSNKYGFQYDYTVQNRRFLQTSGFETRGIVSHQLGVRFRPIKPLLINLSGKTDIDERISEQFIDANYSIETQSASIKGQYKVSNKISFEPNYEFSDKINRNGEVVQQSAQIHNGALKLVYTQPLKGYLDLSFRYVDIQLEAENDALNPQVEFALLDGFRAGGNYVIQFNWNRKISKNLQFNFLYEGRKLGDGGRLIHTGSAQVTALF